MQVQSGTLDLAGGGSASGTFEVSANATLQFGGNYTLSLASSVTGAGSASFSGGTINASGTYDLTGGNTFSGATVNFSGNYTITGQAVTLSSGTVNFNAGGTVNLNGLTLSGGILGGTLTVLVNGPFTWSSGTINNTGGVTLNGASSLSGASTGSMGLSGLLVNAGTLTWSGGANNLYMEGGAITNLAAGTITITADVSAVNAGGGTIGNAGLLRKTTTTGTTTIGGGIAFINTGTMDVQSGAISVIGSHTLTNGTFNFGISNAASFGTVTLSGAAALTGTLSANLEGGFLPAVNNSWQIINYTSPSGAFTQTNLPPVAVWQVTTNPTSLTIKVLKLVPQMIWTNPADIVYGTALSASQLDATASYGAAVPGIFTYNPPLGTVLRSGSNQTLSVSFAPNDPATYTTVSNTVAINVQKAPLGVTANNQAKTYGQNITFAGTEFSTSGLVPGDTATSGTLSSTGAASTAAVSGSPYPITITNAIGNSGLTNYNITYVNGSLTVSRATLGITANSTSKTYGQSLTFAGTEFTTSGLQNSETVGSSTLTSAGAVANASVSGSPYSIVPSAATGGTFFAGNYTIAYTNGALTLNKAVLTITANNTNKIVGETLTLPGTAFTATGLKNSETVGSVTLTSAGTPASAPVGGYNIVPSAPTGGTFAQGNYTNSFVNGILSVLAPPSLTVTVISNKYVLKFPTLSGQIYQLQSTTNLAAAGWSPLGGSIAGTGSTTNVTNAITVPESFFRLQIAP